MNNHFLLFIYKRLGRKLKDKIIFKIVGIKKFDIVYI